MSLREARQRLSRWWCWLWTGEPTIEAKRRALDHEVRRFGGEVTWRDAP